MSELMRQSTLSCAIVLVLIGMILSIAAILSSSWQVVNLQEYNSVHEHGLWLDCTRHVRDGHALLRRYTTISEPLHCVYKFDYDKYSGTFDTEDDNSPVGEVNRHKFYGWHTATLILLTLALLTSLLSLCMAACGCCYASLAIVFTISTLLTSFLSNVALGLFFFFSHRADNRFIKGIVATYEQRVGLAFFLQMAACAVHFIALAVAAVSTYFAFTVKGGALDRYSIQNSSKTNMTNVGRSMEFEHPIFTQNPQKGSRASPYYTSSQQPVMTKADLEFERAVADSMPELVHARSYQSDILPARIRRKSETCV